MTTHMQHSPGCMPAELRFDPEEPPSPPVAEQLDHGVRVAPSRKKMVAKCLAKLIIKHGVHHTAVASLVGSFTEILGEVGDGLWRDIAATIQLPMHGTRGVLMHEVIKTHLHLFAGLETAKRQLAFIKEMLPYVEPVSAYLGERPQVYEEADGTVTTFKEKHAVVCNLDIQERLQHLINQTQQGANILAASEKICEGTKNWCDAEAIEDVMDASNFREHRGMQEPQPPDTVVVVLQAHADEVRLHPRSNPG